MKKLFLILVVACLALFSTSAFAEPPSLPTVEPIPGEPTIGAVISPLKKGQVAPFSGVLLSPKAIASMIVEMKSFDERLSIEIERVKGESAAQCDFEINKVKIRADADKEIAQAKLDESLRRIDVYEEMAREQQESATSPVTWGGIGFVLGVATTILIVYASSQASR